MTSTTCTTPSFRITDPIPGLFQKREIYNACTLSMQARNVMGVLSSNGTLPGKHLLCPIPFASALVGGGQGGESQGIWPAQTVLHGCIDPACLHGLSTYQKRQQRAEVPLRLYPGLVQQLAQIASTPTKETLDACTWHEVRFAAAR